MSGLIPWRKRKTEPARNGGSMTMAGDFPALLRRMRNEFDELFHRFELDWPTAYKEMEEGWNWGMTMEDKDDCVIIRAEAPGFEPGDFDLRVSGNRLVLRASHKKESKGEEGEYSEEAECHESVTLPPGTDKDKVDARYHNGVLTVTIAKTKEGKGRRIAVKEG